MQKITEILGRYLLETNRSIPLAQQDKFVMQCITEAAMFWTTVSKIFPLH